MTLSDLVPEFLSDETARLKKRSELHAERRRLETLRQEVKALGQQRRRYEEQKEPIADEMSEKISAIAVSQAELRQATHELIVQGKPIPKDLTDRQASLVHEKNSLTAVYKERLGDLDEMIKAICVDIERLVRESQGIDGVMGQLRSRGVGDPQLLFESHTARSYVRVAMGWRNSVSDELTKLSDALREKEERRNARQKDGTEWPRDLVADENNLRWEVACLTAELWAADAHIEDANNEVVRLREALTAE